MKSNLGKPLSKNEMKAVLVGKIQGCATQAGQLAAAYTLGCCYATTGLVLCPPSNTCQYPANCPAI